MVQRYARSFGKGKTFAQISVYGRQEIIVDRPARQSDAHFGAIIVKGGCRAGDQAAEQPKDQIEKWNGDDNRQRAKQDARPGHLAVQSVIVMRMIAVDHIALVTIAAFDKALVLWDRQPDPRMPQVV
jgi:hypothetical protein